MAVELITLGCRLNTYESEVMRGHAMAAGMDDVIIINTCAVTAGAERENRQAIRRARRANPNAKIIVTGCSAQIHPEMYADMTEVDHVIGNDAKLKAETFMGLNTPLGERIIVNDIQSVRETAGHLTDTIIGGFEGRTRAFLQVQNGCDHRCTFCIIPYGRGPSRSVAIGEIAAEVRKLVDAGYKEVIMTGVDVTSYGGDLPGKPTLGQMIRRVLALVPELPRLRLSSLDPVEIDEDLWRLIAEEPRLMPHLHMSLQHGDDLILKRMKRRHLRADAIEMAQRARGYRPDMTFGADLITGFPTETEDMFQNTLRIVDECDLTWLHVFPYSEREGTPAAKMPPVPHELRKERAARLRAKGAEKVREYLNRQVGLTQQLLVERGNIAHTPGFAPVKMVGYEPSTLVTARITAANDDTLEAVAC
ncbi:MAG: tRNA (N(6)-L-threonylcarbamoyladenosine(37)-C(2))-methylthiotransferase MtaB [Bdellovibrionales bacterium]